MGDSRTDACEFRLQCDDYKSPARALEVTASILFTSYVTPRADRHSRTLAFVLLLGVAGVLGAASTKLPQPNWAFQPVTRPAVPTSKNAAWSTNAIDRFLLAKLEAQDLSPAPPTDPRALARRLHFILTGLPPTPDEVEVFVRESAIGHRPSAIAKLVDRLLASPHFGERFARHWQDVVRYADTHGTEHDAFLPHAWRYRDYLIRAFNSDLPYDQFVREHIAGDLLEKPRWAGGLNESLLATAWWRLVEFNQTPVDVKGEEVIVVDSQIDALSKAFLGLTVSCARCHDHKFDPISQRDFHGLYSILASTRTSMRVLDAPEKLYAQDAELAKVKGEIRSALAATWKQQIEQWPTALSSPSPTGGKGRGEGANASHTVEAARWRTAFAAAETNKSPLAPLLKALAGRDALPRVQADRQVGPTMFADFTTGSDNGWFATDSFTQHTPAGGFSLATTGSNIVSAICPAGRFSHLLSDKHPGTLRSPNFTITNKFIAALVTGDNNARVRLVIENFQGDSLLFTQVTPKLTDRSTLRWVTLPIRDTWRGRRAYIELVPRDDFPYLGIVKDATKLPTDGRSAAGIAKVVFHDGEKPPEPPAWPNELDIPLRSFSSLAPIGGEGRGKGAASVSQTRPTFAAAFVATARRAVEAWQAGKCEDAQANFLNSLVRLSVLDNAVEQVGQRVSPDLQTKVPAQAAAQNQKDRRDALSYLVTRFRELESRVPVPTRVVAVSDEAPAFETPFFPRGDHTKPGAPVPRQFLSAFGNASYQSRTSGRREMAEDILRNPLTARVMVNRLWHHVFGAGLVRSTDNFGKLAEEPSHPELLDWLASEFVARGWSVKAMLRLMLTSRAFAMGTETSPAATERDPDNRLLSHASLRRLDAESLRDAILVASGRLDRTPFGPGVPVPIPPGQRDDYSPVDGPIDGRGRRSLYLELRRNHPSPFLFAFDQPKPAAPAGRREATNVPAQSLTLLNDPFVIEQAGHFAARALAQPGDPNARIRWLYATALNRPATELEVTRAAAFLAQQATAHGDQKMAWQDLAHAVFNLKEFLYLK
ncbi:MAG: hypothetical protein FD161_1013 [Limisphaerales bacterium]|nr:MAG: hypothetical protein FD161_1013 [Limisphaerales bacterium]KAG0509796.1 MAG: hypothetical protein E1N63_1013 [Limisphaerales bacterium]TXT50982.1 MAG: hypothetical protein FD140_2044 [Limisphaerales bacterium]